MAPEHDLGPRLKVQASRRYGVPRPPLPRQPCLATLVPNAKWEQGRERPGKEGRLKGIGKLTPRNPDVWLTTTVATPRTPARDPTHALARTAVVGTFTNSVTGKLQLLHVRDVWRSVEREHARRRHLVDRWNVLVGAGVTSIANRAFSVGPVTFTLAAGFLSLVEQGEELSISTGPPRPRRVPWAAQRAPSALSPTQTARSAPYDRTPTTVPRVSSLPALHLRRVDLDLGVVGLFRFSQTRALSTTRRLTDKRLDRSLGAGFSAPCHEMWISSSACKGGAGALGGQLLHIVRKHCDVALTCLGYFTLCLCPPGMLYLVTNP
ncbi:uncharacterized protein HRG_11972 [Hirsutella rhossiliensis]|uniref:Uncharacterized protein n=1 Tax=Hirsutella rhossiliensis TaxID=111463 RepID=A0A9P8MKT2_9HYPO|nr:uncharacterized protein HRG_11972 [Hirsutella rhossiliensis]KAH0956965.1 hypothetical protein HRG_11972 [Hirsutella rhossiliensis]